MLRLLGLPVRPLRCPLACSRGLFRSKKMSHGIAGSVLQRNDRKILCWKFERQRFLSFTPLRVFVKILTRHASKQQCCNEYKYSNFWICRHYIVTWNVALFIRNSQFLKSIDSLLICFTLYKEYIKIMRFFCSSQFFIQFNPEDEYQIIITGETYIYISILYM